MESNCSCFNTPCLSFQHASCPLCTSKRCLIAAEKREQTPLKSRAHNERQLLWKIRPPSPSDVALPPAPNRVLQEQPAPKPPVVPIDVSRSLLSSAQPILSQSKRMGSERLLQSQARPPPQKRGRGTEKCRRPPLKRAYVGDICQDDAHSPANEVIDLESDKENMESPAKQDCSLPAALRDRPQHNSVVVRMAIPVNIDPNPLAYSQALRWRCCKVPMHVEYSTVQCRFFIHRMSENLIWLRQKACSAGEAILQACF